MIRKILLCASITLGISAQEIAPVEEELFDPVATQKAVESWKASEFGLKPHYPNYLLPYGYATKNYRSYTPSDQYKQSEAQLQVSLKIEPYRDLLGLDEVYSLAYTHRSFWQAYTESSPFRETNYNPEIFVTFPASYEKYIPSLRSITFGIGHLSNGQGNIEKADIDFEGDSPYLDNRSRSVNYIYSAISFEYNSLFTKFTLWLPNRHNNDLEDNPDIMDYIGYGNIEWKYFYNDHLLTLMTRMSLETKKGAVEATYSYPVSENVYFYTKVFSGYGESLIDYNINRGKISVGFSFSR